MQASTGPLVCTAKIRKDTIAEHKHTHSILHNAAPPTCLSIYTLNTLPPTPLHQYLVPATGPDSSLHLDHVARGNGSVPQDYDNISSTCCQVQPGLASSYECLHQQSMLEIKEIEHSGGYYKAKRICKRISLFHDKMCLFVIECLECVVVTLWVKHCSK